MGDRIAELNAGIGFLRILAFDHRVRESPRFETAPVDCPPDSPAFLNSVAEIKVDSVMMAPLNLFGCLEEFEMERGREPFRDDNAPRPLDLDIIYYGTEHFNQMGLVIPHPRAHLRQFVLEPLAYIRPDLLLPGQTKTVRALWDEMKKQTGVTPGRWA